MIRSSEEFTAGHQPPCRSKGRLAWVGLIAALLFVGIPVYAQNNFNSGSTGTDGAFSPTTSQTIQIPEGGVFNYTTVNIPSGVTITYTRNSKNTPVTLLASGNVTIAGSINIDGKIGNSNGSGGAGGAGGFSGGTGGYTFAPYKGINGDGRGGGGGGGNDNGVNCGGGGGGGYGAIGSNAFPNGNSDARIGIGGPRYGSETLLPLLGGSGGGGGSAFADATSGYFNGGAGGGGGGAILIASSGTITFTGTISGRGGNGAIIYRGGGGGAGSGGAVRLIANIVTGTGTLDVRGGDGGGIIYTGSVGGSGGSGYLRVEAYDYANFNATSYNVAISFALPNAVSVPSDPQLRIISVGAVSAPTSPTGSLQGVPDIVLPSSQANPVNVVIQGANIAVGTVVQVTLTPSIGERTIFQSGALSGTFASSSATASVTLPSGMCVITASAFIDLTTTRSTPMFIDGEKVKGIEVAAVYGSSSQVTYITQSGRRVSFQK